MVYIQINSSKIVNIKLLNTDEVAQLRDLVLSVNNIVVTCHINADGDALGSSIAWAAYLKQLGKNVTVIVPDLFPDFLKWIPGVSNTIRFDKKTAEAQAIIKEAELICCLDFNTLSRSGSVMEQELRNAGAKKLLIDHHLEPDIETALSISLPDLSSTSEIVFCLIWQLGGYDGMTREMATAIYTGMMTDTGGFTYNSTRPEIYFIISQLLMKGIDKDRIYRNVYHTFSVDRLRLTGYIMYQKLKVLTPLRVSYYTISREDQKRFHFIKGDAEGLVNIPLQIKGHKLSISLREDTEKNNLIWVSLRSVDDIPCNEMAAEFFNGGGHKNASGGRLYCSLQEAETVVRNAVRKWSSKLL